MSTVGRPSASRDDDDISAGVIASAVASLAIAAVAVAARFYTRAVIMRGLAAEDWFVLAAWLLSIGYTVSMVLEAMSALGRHSWTLQAEDLVTFGKVRASWAALLFYQLSLTCSKISILLLYLRVLTYSWARRAAWVLVAVVVIYNTLYFVSTLTLCVPIEALWNRTVRGSCHTGQVYMWTAIGFHIVTDFLMFALPLPVVIMTAALPQRIMLLIIFALGFLVCVISLLRAVLIKPLLGSADFTWDFVTVAHWTSVEVNAAVVCACLLVIRPLLGVLWSKLRPASWLRVGRMSLGSGQPTIGSESVTGIRLPFSMDRLEGGSSRRDRVLLSGTEAEDSTAPMGNVAQQYAAAMKEVSAVR
ncbi:hypothetical protein B0T18DRAFT_59497 [Schizothecium vesticola]|uniref:Rhodopsin domain-containing protein n=1 Tax=Schizothecium vesticola TaxID=314040 RepID=A0AA40F4T1_9PEZI|nr:hypothetical protein B0T18DRAFT_59497 [Schizothecium vesticola]